MPLVPAYAEGPLDRLAADLGNLLRRPVRPQWLTDDQGDPCVWLEVLENPDTTPHSYRRIGSLTIRQRGPASTYSVTPIEPGSTGKFAALATALRSLRAAVVKSLKRASSPAPAPSPVPEPSRPKGSPPTFTAAEAITHPAIRAAILAGLEVAEATGQQPAPATMIELVNAALPVVALVEKAYRPQSSQDDAEGAAWTERVLVGMLSGALRTARRGPDAA